MKKIIAFVLVIVICMGLCACGEVGGATSVNKTTPTGNTTPCTPTLAPTAPTTEPTTAPTTQPATEPATNPSTEPSTEPTTQPATEPATEPHTKPATEPTTEPTAQPTTDPGEDQGQDYVVNTSSGKFHYPSCSSADRIKESNRWDYHGTRDDLIGMGYDPCKRCNP